jgi:hypothetical protein
MRLLEDSRWPRPTDLATILLLLVGGFTPLAIGWVIGAVMLWRSETWSQRDKLLGTLILPGGLSLPVFVAGFGVSGGSCSGHGGPMIPTVVTCQGGITPTEIGLGMIVVLCLFVLAELVSCGRLFLAARVGNVLGDSTQ